MTLTLLTVASYRRAMEAHTVQKETQLRVDYTDKEDAVLRAMVNITPNRAIRAMQSGSNGSGAARDPLRWQNIYSDSVNQANARTSVSSALMTQMGAGTNGIVANAGDNALADLATTFDAIEPEPGYMSTGMNRSLGGGFPVPLEGSDATRDLDKLYPIISSAKSYGSLASGPGGVSLPVTAYPQMNVSKYPDIRFGYSAPGEDFVCKRNWWAFSLQLGEGNSLLKSFAADGGSANERDFILSIYEIPSQLAVSAEAFASLGSHADGTPWQDADISGGIYTTRVKVDAGMHLERLSARRGLTLGSGVTVGPDPLGGNPLTPGVREQFEADHIGTFMPVSLGSESSRAAFIPINRGADFFDRFAHSDEANVLSPTTWNNYSVGALQCAMRLDVTGVRSGTDPTPTMLRFSFMNGTTRVNVNLPQTYPAPTALELGYSFAAAENSSYNFGTQVVDVAYGAGSKFVYLRGVTGPIAFNNGTFGDPNVGVIKTGYWRRAAPFEVRNLRGTKRSICVYPERIPGFLAAVGGSNVSLNNSLAVNVDYTSSGLNNPVAFKPKIPCGEGDFDYGVLLTECGNLTPYTKGFSLVTNLRLYIGDDFNAVPTMPPSGSGLPSPFYPPASLFAPEKRYGTDNDPNKVKFTGQLGHLGGDTGLDDQKPVHLLDIKMGSEVAATADKIKVNLKPITHPAEMPPITMMNWLVMIEERRKAFYNADGTAR
ncbi:hypothetical protein [Luteolibacter sp. Populi]|uniref:hypothetical protein n=1 Tax=Luteolibacter sp. Populi TaxID=3230487 RepID=UPI0034677457